MVKNVLKFLLFFLKKYKSLPCTKLGLDLYNSNTNKENSIKKN